MKLVDPALPASEFLLGGEAIDVLRLPVEAGGGIVEEIHPVHVQYRPGSDVVVRYSAQVSWNGAPATRETLIAASALHRTYPGVVPIVADTRRGRVEIGVWRWPFDPILTGLSDVVSPSGAAAVLGERADGLSVRVVAYLPTERAVVRVERAGEPIAYVKVVAPDRVSAIADRHATLRSAGVPVAPVVLRDSERGLLGLDVLAGPTLRELVKSDSPGWPTAGEFHSLLRALAAVETDGSGPTSRLADGPLHARMLATVAPEFEAQLDDLADHFEAAGPIAIDGTVHGDLHEGQVIVDDGRIVGLLDIDDLGPGSTVDDWANLISRMTYRSTTVPALRKRIEPYVESLTQAALAVHPGDRLDLHVSAALVGLATGPFRIQADGWRSTVADLLDRATSLTMRGLSS